MAGAAALLFVRAIESAPEDFGMDRTRRSNSSQASDGVVKSARALAEQMQAFRFQSALVDFAPESGSVATDTVPGYSLEDRLGSGGQGAVYAALQHSTGRKVAIKLLPRNGLTSTRERYRFESEVQALSQLRHKNIVTVHDAGTSAQFSYLVMDYIEGRPIDQYVRNAKPGLREIVAIFVQVCEAVHAAHLKAITHRDLKPRNILVTDRGEPFVVDFGLAKLHTQTATTSESELTISGQFVGTPIWASPEQADGDVSRLDLRTDVYTLGLVLYQLVTGEMPYETTGSQKDVFERIRHAAPRSARLWRREVDADLDTIILQCLAKEPQRRYQTAGELAADLRRYLASDPILARRDSLTYVARKLLRRHRIAAGGATAFLAVLIVAVISVTMLWRQVDADRRRAETGEASARELATIIANLLRGLSNSIKKFDQVDETRRLLQEQVNRIESQPFDLPAVEADVRLAIGGVYSALGDWAAADRQFGSAVERAREAHSEPSTELADALSAQARARAALNDEAGAERRWHEAAGILSILDHERTPKFVHIQMQLVAQRAKVDPLGAREMFNATLRLADELHCDVDAYLKGYAECLYAHGYYEAALPLHRCAIALARRNSDPPNLSHNLHSLACVLIKMARFDEAELVERESLALRERMHPDGDIESFYTYASKSALGEILTLQRKFVEAENLLLDAYEKLEPPAITSGHPASAYREQQAATAERLATLYETWAEAEPTAGHSETAACWRIRLKGTSEP
jgi:eukaryotic-like serine/threonine-protein kinase